MRHILRSSSNTATADTGAGGQQDARLPPTGRGSVHALANKMSSSAAGEPTSPPPRAVAEQNQFSGLINRAKEGLSSSGGSSRTFQQRRSEEPPETQQTAPRLPDKSETQIQWEEIEKNMARSLTVRS